MQKGEEGRGDREGQRGHHNPLTPGKTEKTKCILMISVAQRATV